MATTSTRTTRTMSPSFATTTLLLLAKLAAFYGVAAAELSGRDCVEHRSTQDGVVKVDYKLCIGRASLVEVGQNTSMDISWHAHDTNLTDSITLDVDVEYEQIAEAPTKVTIVTESDVTTKLWLTGMKAGRTVISFNCSANETNASSCPIPKDHISQLDREVSFVHFLILEICAIIVGWIYTICWLVSYYPQTYYSCKRRSVVGLNFDFVGMCFTSNVAYLAFNAGLFWIPVVQDEYFRRHPEGVNPVQINDVIFSIHATLSTGIWVLQCVVLKRDNQRVGCIGGLYIGSLWLLMLICVLMGAFSFLTWLDALSIISYITLVTTVVKYIPLVWSNFRRKSTEGFSPYTTTINLFGGIFSLLQMLIIAYNYDDWKSIFGDFTKFGYGLITVAFELIHFIQHYIIYRGAWMKKQKLSVDCECSEVGCKHSSKKTDVHNVVALPDKKIVLKQIDYFV